MLSKRSFVALPLLLLALLLLFHQPLLTGLGDWLAPTGEPGVEAVVLEGTQVLVDGGVKRGIALLREAKARRLYLVLHFFPGDRRLFAIQDKYTGYVGRELENLGLRPDQYRVLMAPLDGHPITLAEARHVVPVLSRDGIKKSVLLTEGFHTRRSWRVYQRLGDGLGIHFEPSPYFPAYPKEKWWQYPEGVKDFLAESGKLVYYLARGYL
jgi:hypothetical protein